MLFIGIGLTAAAQPGYRSTHHFDMRQFNLGFTIGGNYTSYNVAGSYNKVDRATGLFLRRAELKNKFGLQLGLITSLKLHENFDLRFIPAVSLEQRDFNFVFASKVSGNDSVIRRKVEAAYMNIPLLIKFKSNFYDKYRVYVVAGPMLSVNMASTKKVTNDPDLLKTLSTDVSFVTGVGIDLYGDKLRLAPELKYSFGLANIYLPKNAAFADAIKEIFSQTLTLSVNFE